ncbi:MAG: hypothetical protein NTV94_09305, partial [Planctomycetota bacterium]|nr:hypothetical protein [Planctomycetota bacterium]
ALSETTQAQLRVDRKDERLWMLRTKIAQRITPPQIEQMTAGLIDLQPIAPYNALTREQLAALTDDPPVGPPGLLNPGLALESADEVPGGGESSGSATVVAGKPGASKQNAGSQTNSKGGSATKAKPATKSAKPASTGKPSGKGAPAGTGKPSSTSKPAGMKPGTKTAPQSGPKSDSKPGSKQAPKTSPTRVARNDEKTPQEN